MDCRSTVWITDQEAKDLGIKGSEFPCRILDLKTLVYEILRTGAPEDIVVLPFIRNFDEVVRHIRDRDISGPIIIYTNSDIMQMNLLDYASQGIIFLDSSRFTRLMVLGFITFLQKRQEFTTLKPPHKALPTAAATSTHDTKEIRDLFRNLLHRRAKLLLTCQFKDDLPTLSVTCEIIKMVGEIETKLVLDNFNPEEFVALYNQLGRGTPISGFITLHTDTLGFTMKVASSRMGKITTYLPEVVYEQKRKFFRVEPDPKDPVTLYIQPDGHSTKAIPVRDVSEGGVGMVSSFQHLEKDARYPIVLVLPKNQILMGNATIMFKDETRPEGITYGMELSFHPTDLLHLQYYVYKRQAGILASIRNLSI